MTADELLQNTVLSEGSVETTTEDDNICIIDPKTREIQLPVGGLLLGVESDEKVERIVFQCPKIVGDGVDLSTLAIRINYSNANNEGSQSIAENVQEHGDNITFEWLLPRHVTMYKGTVNFIVCAVKAENYIISNEWNTTLAKATVLEGLEVDQVEVPSDQQDVIAQLIQLINAAQKSTSEDAKSAKASAESAASSEAKAAESATAAQLAAQEALGFRTFFSSVPPDENGDLDPSRPMSVPKGSSVTIKSKGDRIQSVQVDGFTTRLGAGDPSLKNVREITMGGIRFVELVMSAENVSDWRPNGPNGAYALKAVVAKPTNNASTAKIYCTVLRAQPANPIYAGFATGISVNSYGNIAVRFTNGLTPEQYIKRYGDFAIWYQPSDESQATGLYIPIKAQGHEYRCQCLSVTEALGVGDNVQSNVPSGCDQKVVFNGSQSALSVEDIGSVYRIIYPLEKTVSDTLVEYTDRFPFFLNYTSNTEHFYAQNQNVHFFLDKSKFNGMSSADIQTYFQSHPVILYYRSTAYTPQNDIQVQLEMHQQKLIVIDGTQNLQFSSNYNNFVTLSLPDAKTGQYTSDDLICDIYPTGTYAEGSSQIYVTSAGTTLGIHDPKFTDLETAKLLLSENPATVVYTLGATAIYAHDPVTLKAMPYTLHDSNQTIGTYIVSSQDNTVVTVSLKAMQDGGDAATLGGMTLDDIKSIISSMITEALK